MEPVVGFEPTTDGLQNRCSTTELNWHARTKLIAESQKTPEITSRISEQTNHRQFGLIALQCPVSLKPSLIPWLVLFCLAFGGQRVEAQGWRLIWADEFSQPDGASPDPAKWVFDIGGDGWGNNELETYTSRTNNVRIEGGQLVIEARKENY